MRLSKRTEYGIKAAIRLALRSERGYTQSRELAESEQLPAKFLESILLALRSASILESKVGAGGGYKLARPADSIYISELVAVLDPETAEEPIQLELSPGRAALSHLQERIDSSLEEILGSLTLAELAELAESRSDSDFKSPAARMAI